MIKKLFTMKNAVALLLTSLFVGVLGTLWKSDIVLLIQAVTILVFALLMAYKLRVKRAVIGFVGLAAFVYVGSGTNGLLALSAFGAVAMFISNIYTYRLGARK